MENDNNLKEVMQIAVYWMKKNLREWSWCTGSKIKEWKMHSDKQDNKVSSENYITGRLVQAIQTRYLQNT